MGTYALLLDQITPFLESQFSSLPEELKERISQAGMGEKTEETPDGVEEYEWAYIKAENKYLTDEEAKEIEEGDGIPPFFAVNLFYFLLVKSIKSQFQ